jgi:hypothetical protein
VVCQPGTPETRGYKLSWDYFFVQCYPAPATHMSALALSPPEPESVSLLSASTETSSLHNSIL